MRYEHIARVLEAARFDGCFFADTLGLPDIYKGSFDTYLRYGGQLSYLDPMIVLPVMARATRNLGLGATLAANFPVELGRFSGEQVGPHPVPQFQIIFNTTQFPTVVPWLMLNREGL